MGVLEWTVVIGRMDFDTIPSIPDLTLSFTQSARYRQRSWPS